MNRFCITIVLIAISINNLFSQEIVKPEMVNINPDRSGDQWIVGGHRERTKAELKKLHSTPEFSPERSFRAVTLPSKINNATHKAFRSIFRQTGNCCAQASGISYNLTYELNLLRGTSANSPENLLPSHYTWAFMNWGGNYGSLYTDGWDIVIQNGCPNITDYGSIDANGDCTFWMSGYNRYKRAMKNRIKNYQTIDLTKVSGINNLKRWIFDHGRGDKTGGLANFAVYSRGATMKRLTGNTEEKGKYVITKWGKTGPHAMTIVGYNDNIRYDYNGDGKYTNNIDINADGKVDVKDWECGAFVFANSWGTGWANNGFCYMMYKVCAEPKSNGGLKEDNLVHIINVEEVPDTRLTLRMKLKHSRRENLRIKLGYSPDDKGYKSVYNKEFKMFNYYTGDNNIRGKNAKYDDALEVELDIDDFYEKMVEGKGKFYITVDNYKGKGRLTEATVTDHVRGKKYRVDYKTRTDFALLNNYSVPLNNNALILTDNYPFAVNYASSINKLRITNVELAEINNSSEASNYSNFIDKAANLTKGYSYNLSITYGHKDNPAISSQISVWIDWNQDKNLEFSEIATFGFFNKNINTLSKKITVPANAKTGKTLMRMRTSYDNNNHPWGDIYNEGEVEDYTINIADAGTHTSKVDFTADKTVITEGESVRFHNNSDTGSYSWAFEGATPEVSDIKNPTVAYHTPGIYRVKLTVTRNGVSNSKTVNNYITVNKKSTPDKPYVNFTADKTEIIQGESVQFTDKSESEVDRYMWIFTGGTPQTSRRQNPVVKYNTPGKYRVILTIYKNGITNSKKILNYITVKEKPVTVKPNVNFTADKTVITEGESVRFHNNSDIGSYSWEFEGATPETSDNDNPTVAYHTPGIYRVKLTVTKDGVSNSKTVNNYITVNKKSTPDKPYVNFTADKTEIIQGESVQFTDKSESGVDRYVWIFTGGTPQTSRRQNPVVKYNTPGKYRVILTIYKNGIANSKKILKYITVKEKPVTVKPNVNFTADKTVITEGESVRFHNNSDIGSYSWEFEGATPETSDNDNPTVAYHTPGVYKVKLTVTKNGVSNSKTINNYITVNRKNHIPTDIILSSNTISDKTSVKSVIADITAVDADKDDTHTFSLEQNTDDIFAISNSKLILNKDIKSVNTREYIIKIKATDNNGGEYKKQFKLERITTAVDEPDQISITLYPNPVTGDNFYIQSNLTIDKAAIYNTNGNKVVSVVIPGGSNTIKADVSALKTGTYIVQIYSNKRVVTQKIIIK